MSRARILAIDQGTSATKCVLVDGDGQLVARAAVPLGEHHPRPGWVEQDAHAIWASVQRSVAACLADHDPGQIEVVGLSTQRESLLMWDAGTGEPISPVISWQDQRGNARCDALRSDATEHLVRTCSGLPLDPMFSAVKASWLLDAHDPDRVRAARGDIRLGTIDSWLLSRLSPDHLIEAGNASRTQLLDVHTAAWDDGLLSLFDVPRACLPQVVGSTGPFPAISGLAPLRDGTPIGAVMADSHAALFGHGAFRPGQVKATFGTGSSVMGLTGARSAPGFGLCLTIAWTNEIGAPVHAAEGNIRAVGATLRWLAGVLDIEVPALVAIGLAAADDGVVLVPGFGGLGAPWWDRDAVGLITNLTLGTTREALARAAVDSVLHQVTDVVDAIGRSVGEVRELFVDGGPTRNDALMQRQSDAIGRKLSRAREPELSALGAAHLAGRTAGIWSQAALEAIDRPRDRFAPNPEPGRDNGRHRWRAAVARAASQPLMVGAP